METKTVLGKLRAVSVDTENAQNTEHAGLAVLLSVRTHHHEARPSTSLSVVPAPPLDGEKLGSLDIISISATNQSPGDLAAFLDEVLSGHPLGLCPGAAFLFSWYYPLRFPVEPVHVGNSAFPATEGSVPGQRWPCLSCCCRLLGGAVMAAEAEEGGKQPCTLDSLCPQGPELS